MSQRLAITCIIRSKLAGFPPLEPHAGRLIGALQIGGRSETGFRYYLGTEVSIID